MSAPVTAEQLVALAAEWDVTRAGWEAQQTLPLDADAFLTRASWYDRNRGPLLLFDVYYRRLLAGAVLATVLPHVWTAAEWPSAAMPVPAWLALFRAAGFCSDSAGMERPSALLTVYRGTTPGRRRGMAWTTDADKAEWFAARWRLAGRQDAAVYLASIEPRAVLALIDCRGEAEVVVDPDLLPRPISRQ